MPHTGHAGSLSTARAAASTLAREILLAIGRFGMDKAGYRQLLGYVRQWPARVWAVEGANGVGGPLAARL